MIRESNTHKFNSHCEESKGRHGNPQLNFLQLQHGGIYMDINTKISCIGTGAMGGAIIGALAKKYKNISVTDKNAAFGKSFAEKNNCTFGTAKLW